MLIDSFIAGWCRSLPKSSDVLLIGCMISDSDLCHLISCCINLTSLKLDKNPNTDDSIQYIITRPLQQLSLNNTKVRITYMSCASWLDVVHYCLHKNFVFIFTRYAAQLSDRGIARLCTPSRSNVCLPVLHSLYLQHVSVTGAMLSCLPRLPALHKLSLGGKATKYSLNSDVYLKWNQHDCNAAGNMVHIISMSYIHPYRG